MIYISDKIDEQIFEQISYVWEETGIGDPRRCDNLNIIKRTLEREGKFYTVKENDNVIGTCWVTCDGRRLFVHHMSILKEYQNKGLGQMLMKEVCKYAQKTGYQCKLEVHEDNPNAAHLYRKFGFNKLNGFELMIKRDINNG